MLQQSPDILIVDDDMDIRYMMQSILNYEGYQTKTCSGADELNTLLSDMRPAAIIMDMLLSGTDGKEICRKLKKKEATKHIPVMMISAHPDAESICREAGADDFLGKPFAMEELLIRVRAMFKTAHVPDHVERLNQYIVAVRDMRERAIREAKP